MGMAEEQGLGLGSLRDGARKLGLPLPRFAWEDPYLVLTLYRSSKAAVVTLDEGRLQALSQAERSGWEFLAGRTGTTQSEYAKNMGVTARTAQRHLAHFVDLGLMRRIGNGPATEYIKT
jgi:predicted HTH transcriptional regulator